MWIKNSLKCKIAIANTEKGHALINAYSRMVSKLYSKPGEDTYVRSFTESENNVNLQPKRWKVTEKKTPLPKSMNMKKLFIKVLSCHEIEIDSD